MYKNKNWIIFIIKLKENKNALLFKNKKINANICAYSIIKMYFNKSYLILYVQNQINKNFFIKKSFKMYKWIKFH